MQERDASSGATAVAGLDPVGGFRALVALSPDAVFVIWEDLCGRALNLQDSRRTIENLLKGMAQ
jgi:hypothetical protein